MKHIYFAVTVIIIVVTACTSNRTSSMKGYWTSDGHSLLFIDDNYIHSGYSEARVNDVDAAKRFFSNSASFGSYELNPKKMEDTEYDYIINHYLEKDFAGDTQKMSIVSEGGEGVIGFIVLFNNNEKDITELSFSFEDDDDSYTLVKYHKIESAKPNISEDKKAKQDKDRRKKRGKIDPWASIFDENDMACYDTGLSRGKNDDHKYFFYMFIHPYDFSDDKTEGTVTVNEYHTRTFSDVITMHQAMRCTYKYKDGVLYLTNCNYRTTDDQWRLMSGLSQSKLYFSADSQELSGDLLNWAKRSSTYPIKAKKMEFDYSGWRRYPDLFY